MKVTNSKDKKIQLRKIHARFGEGGTLPQLLQRSSRSLQASMASSGSLLVDVRTSNPPHPPGPLMGLNIVLPQAPPLAHGFVSHAEWAPAIPFVSHAQ